MERQFRRIERDTGSEFLDWKAEEGRKGTSTIIQRARKACEELKISFKFEGTQGIRIKSLNENLKADKIIHTAVGLGRFLTQKVLRPTLINELIEEQKQHGAAFVTLKENEVSNRILTDIYTPRTNAFYRFVVVGRADCLPTPANIHKWAKTEAPLCGCLHHEKHTLSHILNRCSYNYGMMTERHNRVVKVVRNALERLSTLESAINENTPIPVEGLSEEVANLRPDIIATQKVRGEQILEIIEVTCPYGYTSRGQITLERAYEEKLQKYEPLAQEIRQVTQKRVRVTAVIVSSMGAVYAKSLRDLCCVLNITEGKAKERLGRRMSEEAILGSYQIWRKYIRANAREVAEINEDATQMIREEQELAEIDATLPGEEIEGEIVQDTGQAEEGDEEEFDPGILDWSATDEETREFDPSDEVEL
jgi:hypothetical protein